MIETRDGGCSRHRGGRRCHSRRAASLQGNGHAQASQCGWCKDKWGISWQITPVALTVELADPDPAAARRAFEAMMQMGKIDIAVIEAARRG